MTYTEILEWARRGIKAEQARIREMQEKALEGQALPLARQAQDAIDKLDVHLATLDEIQELHDRK